MMAQTLLYHFTHIDNVASILDAGCLTCKATLDASGAAPSSVAHEHIQSRRASTPVPTGPGGVLHDYVPFYFAPRSPMLYAIHRGGVNTFEGTQRELIYLVTSVERIVKLGLAFVFTDGHGTVRLSRFFEDVADLDQVDWTIMGEKYWRDTVQDNDRSRRRNAEFLVLNTVPLGALLGFAVYSEAMKSRLVSLLAKHAVQHRVGVRRDWYY